MSQTNMYKRQGPSAGKRKYDLKPFHPQNCYLKENQEKKGYMLDGVLFKKSFKHTHEQSVTILHYLKSEMNRISRLNSKGRGLVGPQNLKS